MSIAALRDVFDRMRNALSKLKVKKASRGQTATAVRAIATLCSRIVVQNRTKQERADVLRRRARLHEQQQSALVADLANLKLNILHSIGKFAT